LLRNILFIEIMNAKNLYMALSSVIIGGILRKCQASKAEKGALVSKLAYSSANCYITLYCVLGTNHAV